jgi:STE24 endopeptidase
MQLILVLVICLALFPTHPDGGVLEPLWSLVLTGLGVGLLGLTAELLACYFDRRLRQQPVNRHQIVRRYSRWRGGHFAFTLGIYLIMLYGHVAGLAALDWAAVVRNNWGWQDAILVDELLILAPLLGSLILSWFSFHRVEQTLHQLSTPDGTRFWSRGAYVLFHLRHYVGLVLAPIFLFMGIHELAVWLFPGVDQQEWFQPASMGLLLVMVLLLMPWLLTVIWGAKALPAGPLRDRLVAAARRMRFRYTDILLWNTRGGVANAMVTGIFPVPRYVLLSDGLIQNLQPDEVEAVFGHEIGHVKHQHMPLYLAFLLLSLALLGMLLETILTPAQQAATDWTALLLGGWPSSVAWSYSAAAVAFLGGYIWLIFGFLSRRCERQADIYGCKTVSCPQGTCLGHGHDALDQPASTLCATGIRVFINALERVADLNGIRREKPSWRHSSIARRVAFLEQVLANPAAERRFQRRLGGLKCVLLATLAIVVGVLWWQG